MRSAFRISPVVGVLLGFVETSAFAHHSRAMFDHTKQVSLVGTGFFFPMSDQLHFIERVRMIDRDHVQIDYTVEDPIALTKPIHAAIIHSRVTDFNRMVEEEDCEENERDPVVNGRFTTVVK